MIDNITGCDIYSTHVAEETPLHEHSVAETMGSDSSCTSGDRMQPEAFKHASSVIAHSSPSNINTRITSIVVESEDENFQTSSLTSKAEVQVSTERIRPQSTEVTFVNENTTQVSDILADDADIVALFVSRRLNSRLTVSLSVTLASSLTQSKSPTRQLNDIDIDSKTDMSPLRISGGTTFRVTTEPNDFSHIHVSPQCIEERNERFSVSPSSLNRPDCRFKHTFQNPSLDKPESITERPLLQKRTLNVQVKCMSPLFGSGLDTLVLRKRPVKSKVLFDRSRGADTSRISETATDFYTPGQSPVQDAYVTALEITLV
ncbi:uncharacterized protein DEA37_0013312 [Paragonimus westermani]|uniref:Uncharacterized protein n=1 Tax=Paragonimus westermani TaxID=34504 RepID=A0A5J4NKM4_9TREM|nr:uncharacterized protein DEA37_0013312 [Paragonimus westermani]